MRDQMSKSLTETLTRVQNDHADASLAVDELESQLDAAKAHAEKLSEELSTTKRKAEEASLTLANLAAKRHSVKLHKGDQVRRARLMFLRTPTTNKPPSYPYILPCAFVIRRHVRTHTRAPTPYPCRTLHTRTRQPHTRPSHVCRPASPT